MSAPNLSGLLAGGDADVVWDFNQGAMFSGDRTYRWKLWRRWDPAKPELAVIGLNPSTADETNDDATVRRCLGFARDWGYGRLLMLNLFPYRAKSPITLAGWYSDRVIGPNPRLDSLAGNAKHIMGEGIRVQAAGGAILAAWGSHGALLGQCDNLAALMDSQGLRVACLGLTRAGEPKHPLYLRADTKPIAYLGDGGPLVGRFT